jgi:hypothetical protein
MSSKSVSVSISSKAWLAGHAREERIEGNISSVQLLGLVNLAFL